MANDASGDHDVSHRVVSVLPARKRLAARKGFGFTEINIDDDRKFREEMMTRSGRRTVPQIFIGDKHIGGCDDLFAAADSGELDRILQGV